jgi:hypothetical protein
MRTKFLERFSKRIRESLPFLSSRKHNQLLHKNDEIEGYQKTGLPNPFIFGNPVNNIWVKSRQGREDIVLKIKKNLQITPFLLLYGPRRIGKTSILVSLPDLLGPDFMPCLLDAQSAAMREGPTSFCRYACARIAEGVQRYEVRVHAPTREVFKDAPFTVLIEFLETVEAKLPKPTRVLLCLDEFECLEERRVAEGGTWVEEFLDVLLYLTHKSRFAVLFAGAHTFGEMGAAWTDRFISARSIRVGHLTSEEARLLVTEPEQDFPLRYASGALEALLAATACHPLLTQAVAYELIERLNLAERTEATVEDIDAAIEAALVSASAYFDNVWLDAKEEGQAVLRARVRDEEIPAFPKAERWLVDREVLTDEGKFVVPVMERWVRQKVARELLA